MPGGLLLLLTCHAAMGDGVQTTQDKHNAEDTGSKLLADTPYIEFLLIKREFPAIVMQ
jgi:hypothetical protein